MPADRRRALALASALLLPALASRASADAFYERFRGGETGFGWLHSPPVHRDAELFPVSKDGRWGFIDAKGRTAIEPQFDFVRPFVGGAAAVRVGRKWGVATADGRLIVAPSFDDAGVIQDGMLAVRRGDLWSYISTGQLAESAKSEGRPPATTGRFEPVGDFHEGYAVAYMKRTPSGEESSHLAFVAKSLQAWAPGSMVPSTEFSEGVAAVRFREQGVLTPGVFLIDASGKRLANLPEVRAAKNFSGGLAPMNDGNAWGFVDKAGRWSVPPRFGGARPHSGGRAAVQLGGKWGFIDAKGAQAVPPRYSEVGDFQDGLAAVCEGAIPDRLCGYVGMGGELVIPLRYRSAWGFSRGIALVETPDEHRYIDKKGRTVYAPACYQYELWEKR